MFRLLVMFDRSGWRQIHKTLETGMAGEIRDAMAKLRAAKGDMIAGMLKEIDAVTSDVAATKADGLEAMKLPRAELESTRQEIREIRAEFAPTSNGGPAGPLPDLPQGSSLESVKSAPVSSIDGSKTGG